MKKLILLLILSFSLNDVIITQNDSFNIVILENKIDSLNQKINSFEKSYSKIENNSQNNLEIAGKLIDWTGMFFGALTFIFLIASIIGFKEFAEIRRIKNEVNELRNEMKEELEGVQKMKSNVNSQIEDIKYNLKIDSSNFLKTIYLLNEGINSYHSGRLRRAELKFINLLKATPNDYEATCYLARTYFGQNKFKLALNTINKATALSDKPWRAYYIMAENFRRLGEYKNSIKAFEKSLEIEERETTYTSMGYAYLKVNQYENAIEAFKNSMNILRYSSPVCGLAKALLKNKAPEKAEEYFQETVLIAEEEISAGTQYVWPYFNSAFGFFILNKKRKCISMLKLAFTKNQNPEVIKEQIIEYKLMENENVSKDLLNQCVDLLEKKYEMIK